MNKFSVGVTPTAATETVVFEVPDHQKIVITNIFISNHSGQNKTADLWWEHGHDASHDLYLIDNRAFAEGDLYNLNQIEIVMREGDKLKVLTQSDSSFSVIITFDIYPDNAQLNNFNP
jgi:hypothetical protein